MFLPGKTAPEGLFRLHQQGAGAGEEIQLTDAISVNLARTPLNGYHFKDQRFDCESVAGYVEATLAFVMARPDLAKSVSAALAAPQRAVGWG